MKSFFKKYLFILTILSFIFTYDISMLFCQQAEEDFIYDAMGRRDPFIPLLDKKSPTGLRTYFSPQKQEVKLPLKIVVSGVLWNGREYFAIINDEVKKQGENLGEIQIKKIEKNKVVVKYGEKEFTVYLTKKENTK